MQNISESGISFTAELEGFVSHPYQDSGGIWTVGYGTTIQSANQYHDCITEIDSKQLLRSHMAIDVLNLNKSLKRPLLQHQFDALIDLSYNIGLEGLRASQLFKAINNQDPNFYSYWSNLAIHDLKGHFLLGLARRRRYEARLFIYGNYSTQ